MSTAVSGYKRSFGSDGPPGAYEDLERADVILLIGANIADNHPILWQRLEANPGKTLIVVDPRVTKTAMLADLHLPVKPRSDLALINGLIHILIEHDLIDREYIAAHTTGFDALRESVREYTPERVGGNHRALRRTLCTGPRRSTATPAPPSSAGRWASTTARRAPRPSTPSTTWRSSPATSAGPAPSPFSITGQCNAMGTREAGFASSLPGYRKFESAEDREELAAIWNVPVERIPTARGLAYPDIIEAALDGANPGALDHRDQPDRVVSQSRRPAAGARDARVSRRPGRIPSDADLRARGPGAAGGDLGREGRHVHELRAAGQQGQSRGGSAGRSPRRLRHLSRPRGGARLPDELFPGWTKPERRVRGMEARLGGPSLRLLGHELRRDRGARRHPVAVSRRARPMPPTTRRLYTDGRFQTDDGKARLIPSKWEPFPEQPTRGFSAGAEHGPHGRALAHAHEDRRRCRFSNGCRRAPGSR